MCEGCISSWKKETRNRAEETTVCSCCKILVEIPSRALPPEDAHPREDPAGIHGQTAGEEETEDQGYVLLDQEDHEEEEEEQAEAEQQNEEEIKAAPAEEQVIARGEESMARDDRVKAMFYWLLWMTIAAGEDESVAQGEEIEHDRLVPEVALDGMTVADDSDAGEMDHTDDERDPDGLDTAVLLEENIMLASSVATAPAMIYNSVPRAEELVLQDTTVEIGESITEEEEDIAVPEGKLFICFLTHCIFI
jgi:hypothetical protein